MTGVLTCALPISSVRIRRLSSVRTLCVLSVRTLCMSSVRILCVSSVPDQRLAGEGCICRSSSWLLYESSRSVERRLGKDCRSPWTEYTLLNKNVYHSLFAYPLKKQLALH